MQKVFMQCVTNIARANKGGIGCWEKLRNRSFPTENERKSGAFSREANLSLLHVCVREREEERKRNIPEERADLSNSHTKNTSESCIEIEQQQQRKHYNVEILSEIICHSDIDLMKQNKLNL